MGSAWRICVRHAVCTCCPVRVGRTDHASDGWRCEGDVTDPGPDIVLPCPICYRVILLLSCLVRSYPVCIITRQRRHSHYYEPRFFCRSERGSGMQCEEVQLIAMMPSIHAQPSVPSPCSTAVTVWYLLDLMCMQMCVRKQLT